MNWCICEKMETEYLNHTAGIKARDDLEEILIKNDVKPLFMKRDLDINTRGIIEKLKTHKKVAKYWENELECAKSGDLVIIQFPVRIHTLFLANVLKKMSRRGVKSAIFLHDLEYMRHIKKNDIPLKKKMRIKLEEISVLKAATHIVVHNKKMKTIMKERLNLPEEKMIDLQIFDYLVDEGNIERNTVKEKKYSCIIAGNLDKVKSKYVYDLPKDVNFELFGPNYTGESGENVNYHGSFPPSELPYKLKGSFGLVWDGLSSKSCEGIYGEYLKVNNPHKTSLYLASGLPVIIWKQAALAEFVEKYGVGITVDSLYDLKEVFERLSEEDYQKVLDSTKELSDKLKSGYFTMEAVKKCS